MPFIIAVPGVYLILRRFRSALPVPAPDRIAGIVLLYLGGLMLAHLLTDPTRDTIFQTAAEGAGGGYVGALLLHLSLSLIDYIGTVFALAAWLLVGILLTFRISIPEIVPIPLARLPADRSVPARAMDARSARGGNHGRRQTRPPIRAADADSGGADSRSAARRGCFTGGRTGRRARYSRSGAGDYRTGGDDRHSGTAAAVGASAGRTDPQPGDRSRLRRKHRPPAGQDHRGYA